MNWRISTYTAWLYSVIVLFALQQGCINGSFYKPNIKGPYLHDDLTKGSSKGMVKGGMFDKTGWEPGTDGSITYDVPGVAQGAVEINTIGLNRSDAKSIFITMFEPAQYDYADPYVIHNPYLISVALNNFTQTPQSPFDFLWTMKEFPAGTASENRFVAGLPLGGGGYEKTIQAEMAPVFPESQNVLRIEWKYGKAGLFFNGKKLAEHDYRPRVFNPQSLRLVVGKSPGVDSFGLEHVVIKSVTVSLPGV